MEKQAGTVISIIFLVLNIGQGALSAESAVVHSDVSPRVLFVSVGKAMESKQFDVAVSNACDQMQVKWRTAYVPELTVKEIVISREQQSRRWGKGAVLVVYLADDASLPGLLTLPGQCALINIRTMRSDNPSEEIYDVRLRRLLMKGLAYAAGVGGNHDIRCVMYWKSFSLSGIDATSSTFGPYAFFALQDILGALGGESIFRAER